MDFRKLSNADLVDFAQNVAGQAPNVNGTAIPAPLLASLAASTVTLQDSVQNAIISLTESLSRTEQKRAARQASIDLLAQTKTTMRANENPKEDFELLGFGALDNSRTPIMPQPPTELVAWGDSTNRNYLKFKGNNKSGSVVYVIEYLAGDTMPFTFLAQTKSRKYTHINVTPGQLYNYRVRAEAANGDVSAWSNTAVVYGS